jgi:nicotinate-nucleotide adenylyltransferase
LKIGILGGTFNPVHNGHMMNALAIMEEFSLDRVLLIPAKRPVHKELEGDASAADRLAMLKLAVGGDGHMDVLTLEMDREEPSYTIYTVEELARRYAGAELFLIMGVDSFNEFDTWREYRRIAEMVTIVVMRRPGDSPPRGELLEKLPRVAKAGNPLMDISSSSVRRLIREGKGAGDIVPAPVMQYIKDKRLYLK